MFGEFWDEIAKVFDKPVMLTEFGDPKPPFIGDSIDEDAQAKKITSGWCDIERHRAGKTLPQSAIGGFVYEWSDNWWQSWGATVQNRGQEGWELEYMGLTSQGDGRSSPFLRQLRKSYFALQSYWTGKTNCPAEVAPRK
jgi:hypothetical protein